MTDRPEVRCLLCGARIFFLHQSYYSDHYVVVCPCPEYVNGRQAKMVTLWSVAQVAGDEPPPTLPKKLRGWHGRWMAAGYRERAERWQILMHREFSGRHAAP